MDTLKKVFVVFKERRRKAPFLAPSKERKESISSCHQALVVTPRDKCHTIMYLKHFSNEMKISMYPKSNRLTSQFNVFLAKLLRCDITFKTTQFVFKKQKPCRGSRYKKSSKQTFFKVTRHKYHLRPFLTCTHTHIASLFV